MNQELIAFWNHDQFPFLLGQEVDEFRPGGLVKTTGYAGMLFKPQLILTKEDGQELGKALRELTKARTKEINEVDEKYKKMLTETLRKYKK